MSTIARRILLTTTLTVATVSSSPAADRATFSRTVLIGDSLSDSGYFRPILVTANPQAAILGRFTTNPGLVWSEHLARYYGTDANPNGNGQNGDNYAAGGARMTVDEANPLLGPIPSMLSQSNNYLAANNGHAPSDALYTVWGGANDLFAAAAAASQAQTILNTAVLGQVGIVASLQAAGARYVLVPNIPDIGLTPQFLAMGAATSAQASNLADTYNRALYTTLAAQGLRVIPVDTYHFLQETVASPSRYGFSNVTDAACLSAQSITCNPDTYVTPDADRTYLFADGVHPSAAAHEMLADLALSMIEGPRQVAVLPHSATATGRNRAGRVAVQAVPSTDTTRAIHWWSDIRSDLQRYDHGDHYDGMGPALLAGFARQQGSQRYGGFAGYGHQDNDWGRNRGSWDQTEITLGAYFGWRDGGAWFSGQVSYSWLDFEINRNVPLGPTLHRHHGSATGNNLTLALSTGWDFGQNTLLHGPLISVTTQRINIHGFIEDGANLSTALAYPDQSYDSLTGSIGWQASYQISPTVRPYAHITIDREFETTDAEVFAQSLSTTLPYTVPGIGTDRTWATATIGARAKLSGTLGANLGLSFNAGQKGGKHHMVFVSIGNGF